MNSLYLIAGLGNPGKEYENTRHNAGFMVLDKIAQKNKIDFDKNKFDCLFGKGYIKQKSVILAKPKSYMNLSGQPLQQLAHFYKIKKNQMIIIHDDVDISFGKIKIKQRGGDGGHKGIKSIINFFGGDDFARIRVGVGRPEKEADRQINMIDHVLGNFDSQENELLERIVNTSCDSIYTILLKGVAESMNNFNNKQILV